MLRLRLHDLLEKQNTQQVEETSRT